MIKDLSCHRWLLRIPRQHILLRILRQHIPRQRAPGLRALLLSVAAAAPVLAVGAAVAPPPAPQHLAAHPALLKGYSGARWAADFKVRAGHCDLAAITSAGQHPDELMSLGERPRLNREAAVLIGARVPDLLAPGLASEPDEGDRACMGEVLELGAAGRWVSWDNTATGVHYRMQPDSGHDGIAGACRNFELRASGNEAHSRRRGSACAKGPGLWQLSGL